MATETDVGLTSAKIKHTQERPSGKKTSPGVPKGKTRITADVPTKDADLLSSLAERTGYNKVTTLIRALRVLDVLERARNEGSDLQIVHKDGSRERLLLQ